MQSRVFVECVKCGVADSGPGVGAVNATVKFTKDGVTKWLTNSEVTGIPNFYLTDEDIYDRLMEQDFANDDFMAMLEASSIDTFEGIKLSGDYDEIEEAMDEADNEAAAALLEYIIEITRCSMDDLDDFIKAGTGKYADEIVIPGGERIDFSGMDQETIFKNRLFLEACIKSPHVYDTMEADASRRMKKDLRAAIALGGAGYEEWKEKYIQEQLEGLKDEKFLTVHYVFAGIGNFDEVIREEQLPSFKQWIDGNGSAFMSEPREATVEEIKIYIAKNAVD